MSPEAQRIAIAEACGWRFEHKNKGSAHWAEVIVAHAPDGEKHYGWDPKRPTFKSGKTLEEYLRRVAEDMAKIPIPNYLFDLNAIHEAVASLSTAQKHDYAVLLANQFWPDGWTDWTCTLAVSEAPPDQRAKAYLKALNLWEDSK